MSSRAAWRRTRGGGVGACIAAAGLALACGGEAPAPDPVQADPAPAARSAPASGGANQAPTLLSVEVHPRRPLPGSRVTATAQAADPEGKAIRYEYRWRLNGQEVGRGESAVLTGAQKGDRVEVEVIAFDGELRSRVRSADVSVANQPPRLYTVKLEAPDGVRVGKTLVATPDAQDPDGDRMRYDFEWRVNGERRGDEASFSLAGLRRGDEVVASVVASDGQDDSAVRESQLVKIGNGAPEIVSQPSWERVGDTFLYAVKAEDPDGDRSLRFRLRAAPEGMTVDAIGGLVTWTPRSDQVGRHKVEIEVDDLNGGQAVQSVEVRIDMEEKQPETQAPAAREPAF